MKMNKLILEREIYSESMIKKAIEDYSLIAQIKMDKNDSGIVCTFIKTEYDLDKTIDEFENYLIDLTNSNRDFDYDN